VNNISNAEFDYTEDMTSSENEEDDLDWNIHNHMNIFPNIGHNNNCTP
jgi:hypothetical protein